MKLSEKKRLHILDAAEQLFFEKGVEHTSMDQIAVQASVSKRTVYNHFETKEALFYAIIMRMQSHLEDESAIEFNEQLTLKEQLITIAQQEVNLLTSDNFLRIAKIAMLHMMQQPELAKEFGTKKVGCMTYMETFLAKANEAGMLSVEDVEFAAKQFVYQLKSFIFYPRLYGFEVPSKTQEQTIVSETVAMFIARYQQNQ